MDSYNYSEIKCTHSWGNSYVFVEKPLTVQFEYWTIDWMQKIPFLIVLLASVSMADHPLPKCPDSPNCVSSSPLEDEKHRIEPLKFKENLEATKKTLQATIERTERTKIVSQEGNHWKCEFKTKLLGFTDDVEFFFDEKEKVVHVRSASRIGYSDMGANRKRVEAIREAYASAL